MFSFIRNSQTVFQSSWSIFMFLSFVHVYCLIFGEGNGSPLQYSCLENSMDRGAWKATVRGVAKSWTWLSDCHSLIIPYWYNIKEIEKTFIVITLRISFFFFYWCIIALQCFASNVQWSESAICIHMSPFSWAYPPVPSI